LRQAKSGAEGALQVTTLRGRLETVAESHTERLEPTIGQLTASRLGAVLKIRELNVFLTLIVVGALISLATPYFLTTNNLMGVFRSFSLTAIMSIGMGMGGLGRIAGPPVLV
jgi:hypothetical protein